MASRSINSVAETAHSTILKFWFEHPEPISRWFTPSEAFDDEISTKFSEFVKEARDTAKLDDWTQNPDSTLALLLLLDQFPRNIFRGSPESYQSDSKALKVATEAIAQDFDRQVDLLGQPFFYLPFMHNETLVGQVAGRALYENCVRRCGNESDAKKFAQNGAVWGQQHLEVIARFGRFPSRNIALQRESTKEEIEFLKENPQGF